jgi:hypothetical protein
MDLHSGKIVLDFLRENPKINESLRKTFGEVSNTILYRIANNVKIFNIYNRSECNKYINILDALDALVDGEILIFVSELQLYGIFTPENYLTFTKNLQEKFEDKGIQSTPHQVVLNNHKQKIVFLCAVPDMNTGFDAVITKITTYVKECFGANITVIGPADKLEITIEKIFDINERTDNFEKFVEFVCKKDQDLANRMSILRTVRNREYKYTSPRLNKNVRTIVELFDALKSANNITINAPIVINSGKIGNIGTQYINNPDKKDLARDWVRNHLPNNNEKTTDYYNRYITSVKDYISVGQFGPIVRQITKRNPIQGTDGRHW